MRNDREELIKDIVAREFSMFDKVNNIGGRADCQNDWKTFVIMRRAQYLNWPYELLKSYLEDLSNAERDERNMIAEKYGRMMESTSPDEYNEIKHMFPVRSASRLALQEEIISIELSMDDDFCARYPVYSSCGRSSRSTEDTLYSTSKETYMRGEMSTWSDHTFKLYASWVTELEMAGRNLSELTAENVAKEYGYESLSQLEELLKK